MPNLKANYPLAKLKILGHVPLHSQQKTQYVIGKTKPLKAIAFDAYGTLFDVYSVSSLAEELLNGKGAQLATFWRDKQIDYTRLRTLSDR